MAAEEVTAAMDKDINDHNEAGGHQDWPYREIVAIAGTQELINIWNDNMLFGSVKEPKESQSSSVRSFVRFKVV